MFSRTRLWLVVPVLLCGCTQGFDRLALQERLNDGSIQMTDQDIAAARATRPQLRFPCRIAVYLKPGEHDWRWSAEDRAVLEGWAKQLRAEGIVSEVFPLPDMLTGKAAEVKELRVAAAKCGADVLLIIHGAAETDSYKNAASVFNLTVVGGFLIPGSHRDALFLMEGVLMDVDNGFIYAGAQAEGTGRIVRPTFLIEDRDAIALAKTRALHDFGPEMMERLRRLAGAPTPPNKDGNWRKDVGWKGVGGPIVSDINNKGATTGLTPAGAFAPDLNVPIVKGPYDHKQLFPMSVGIFDGP